MGRFGWWLRPTSPMRSTCTDTTSTPMSRPEQEAVLEFEATIPGVFEIELEGAGVLIGELQVAP